MDSDDTGFWRILGRIALVVGLVAAVIGIIGFLRGGITPGGTAGAAHNGSQGGAVAPTNTLAPATQVPATQAPPTPRPTSTAVPVGPGTVFCSAGGSAGWNGWPVAGSWHLLNGNLVNDGTDGGGDLEPNLTAPDACQPTIADYAVTISVKLDQISPDGASYGIDVRGVVGSNGWQGYAGWLYPYTDCCSDHADFRLSPVGGGEDLAVDYMHGFDQGWHTLQFAVRGNALTLKLDGATILSASDNRFLSPGQIGLVCHYDQIEVQSFQAVAL